MRPCESGLISCAVSSVLAWAVLAQSVHLHLQEPHTVALLIEPCAGRADALKGTLDLGTQRRGENIVGSPFIRTRNRSAGARRLNQDDERHGNQSVGEVYSLHSLAVPR